VLFRSGTLQPHGVRELSHLNGTIERSGWAAQIEPGIGP
jgi:hypothetical protein